MISIAQDLCVKCGRCVAACPCGVFRQGEDGPAVGKEKRCIRCMHCAAACPAKAVVFEGLNTDQLHPVPAQDEVLGLIESRRSIRRYKSAPPDRAVIETALAGAAFAPSAKNQRVCRWTVVYGKARADHAVELALDWVRESGSAPALLAMARAGANLITCGAPCLILCHGPREAGAHIDAGIATTTLELLLSRAGLGTCWAGYLTRLADAAPELRAWLGLPEGNEVYCALMTGYSDGDDYPNLPRREPVQTNWVD